MDEGRKLYIECSRCGKEMYGIISPSPMHRSVCEPCGGNKTIYHEKSPHPEGVYGAEEEDDTMGYNI